MKKLTIEIEGLPEDFSITTLAMPICTLVQGYLHRIYSDKVTVIVHGSDTVSLSQIEKMFSRGKAGS